MSYLVKADPGVSEDLEALAGEQAGVPADWRLKPGEIDATIDLAVRLIKSLRDNPYQGELMQGRANTRVLEGCRRLKFDPEEPWPRGPEGHPRPRLRLVWINEPDEGSIALVRVLALTHRFDSRPYRRSASRLGAVRRAARGERR